MQEGSAASTFAAALEHEQEVGDNSLRDVVALSTLPAIWTGAEPLRIAESLAASVFTMLHPEFVYVSFVLSDSSSPVAIAQIGRYETDPRLADQIGATVLAWSRAHDPEDLLSLELSGRSRVVRVATRQIGLNAEFGVAAAAFAPDYRLRPADLLLLNVAATQAAVAVQNVRLLQSLQVSELRYRLLAEQISDGIYIVDAQGGFLDTNRAGHQMLGYTLDELRALNIADIIAPFERKRLTDQFARLDAGELVRSDWEFKRKDGAVFTGELMARRLPDGRYQGVLRDIAERKLRERRLAEQSRLLDLSSDAIFVRDAGSRILFWNKGAEKLYGFTAEEARNRISHELLGTEFPEPLPLIQEHLVRQGHWSGELIHTKRDGGKIPTFSRWEADIDADGNVHRILESNTDITERKRQEQELRDREAQFRNLAEALPTLCWMAYGDGYIFWYNSRWYEYTGTTPEQMEGWGWQSVHDPEVLPEVMERWNASLRTSENFEMVFPLRRADGSLRPFLTRIVPIRDEGGRIVRWFGTNTDITGQKEIEKELRDANADLEQFAYSASHDLQEPLRTVKVFSQLLAARAREKLDVQSLEYLDNVISGATRMEALIRDLHIYARTTRFEISAESTDANDAIRAALANLKGAVAETGATIDFEPLPTLPVHPTQLELLFQNLISNAIKYRRSGIAPAVQIASKKLNAQWLFSVSDNGIGIEAQYRERIFGLFKRLHTSDSYSGTGIGLALCRRIVERHNGRIWVESRPGEGSSFYFTLPA